MILLNPVMNFPFFLKLSQNVMGGWRLSLQSIERVIFLTSYWFLSFSCIVSDTWGSADSSSSIHNTVLSIFDEFSKLADFSFQGFISVLELIGLDGGVARSGNFIAFGYEFGLFPFFSLC